MNNGNPSEAGRNSEQLLRENGLRHAETGWNHTWVLLWSLLLGGLNVHVAGREPVALYFDLVLVLWLAYAVYWKGFWPDFSGWIMGFGIFWFLSGTLSALVNIHDVYKSLAALKILACGLLVYAIVRRAPVSVFTLSLWGATTGALLLANYQTVQYGEYEGEAGLKDVIGIVLGRSNYVASILLLLIPLAIATAFARKGKIRLLFAACAMLMLAGLVVTMSRGAMLAMVLATVLSLPLMYRAGLRLRHVTVVLCLSVATILFLPFDLLTADAALIAYRWENPDEGRPDLMKASWESFKASPVFGVGPGQLGKAIASHVAVPDYNQQYVNAHNLVLDALAENGLPAGLVLLAMVGTVLYQALRSTLFRPTALNTALWVALLAAVIHNMVEASFEGQHFQVVFWTVAALAERGNSNS